MDSYNIINYIYRFNLVLFITIFPLDKILDYRKINFDRLVIHTYA